MSITRRDFILQLGLGAAGLGLSIGYTTANPFLFARTAGLPRSLPETQGVASQGLLDFVDAVEKAKLNLHSMMVLRRGHVVAEGWWAPYAANYKHTLYSLSKSFTSTAVGMAIGEGKFSLDDKIVSFFPQDVPATVSPNLAAMRVQDLLTMSTGHDKDTTPGMLTTKDGNWAKAFLAQPVDHDPGTFFMYNSGATYMLSAIVQKKTGQPVLDYLKPRLFDPLDIKGADWEVDPNGIDTGGWGLRVKTEDIAKFGQLYLQKGVWQGKRLLAESWIADATRSHIQSKGGSRKAEENDWLQGYGYQFWRCRHNAYRGDGAFGQYCIVIPDQDAVIAITSETADMQGILDQVWNHILPALKGVGMASDKKAVQAKLKQEMASLSFIPPTTLEPKASVDKVSGKTYRIADNSLNIKSVLLKFKPNEVRFTMEDEQGPRDVLCGLGEWRESTTGLSPLPLKLVPTSVPNEKTTTLYATGAWLDDQTFSMIWRFIETAHYERVTCTFQGDTVQVEFKKSLAILNPDTKDTRPILQGQLSA
jgi:CubicO group peptidase (beta-lactamase class C family)